MPNDPESLPEQHHHSSWAPASASAAIMPSYGGLDKYTDGETFDAELALRV